MSKAKRSWREKLQDNKDLPKVIRPKGKGELNPKNPGGVEAQARRLR
jgi:hypothetical protein